MRAVSASALEGRRGSGTQGQRPVNFLLEGETCVCYFVGVLVLSQPKISRRLAYLRRSFLPAARELDALQASRGSMMILLAGNPRLRPCHAPLGNGPKTSTDENPGWAGFLGTPPEGPKSEFARLFTPACPSPTRLSPRILV